MSNIAVDPDIKKEEQTKDEKIAKDEKERQDQKLQKLEANDVSLPKGIEEKQHNHNKQPDQSKDDGKKRSSSRANSQKSKSKVNSSQKKNQQTKQQKNEQKPPSGPQSQNDQAQRVQRPSLKSLKTNSNLVLKYQQRSKQTSRALERDDDLKNQFKSTQGLLQRRKLSKKDKESNGKGQELESKTGEGLEQQNKRLKNKTNFLMQELKNIEVRLNRQLSKRGSPTNKKNIRVHSVQNVSNRQALNADKRCKIYQKQIQGLKLKASFFNQDRINQLTDKIQKLQQSNTKLQQEKKQYKKNAKHFQKILDQIGDGDYLKIREQNQQLRSENRKLKEKIKKQEQEQRMGKLSASNEKIKSKKQQEQKEIQKKKEQEKQERQINILKSKSQRDDKKIKVLTYETHQNKEKMEQMQKQIQEKDKEIEKLKQKIKSMKRLNDKIDKDKKQKEEKDGEEGSNIKENKSIEKEKKESGKINRSKQRQKQKQKSIKNMETSRIQEEPIQQKQQLKENQQAKDKQKDTKQQPKKQEQNNHGSDPQKQKQRQKPQTKQPEPAQPKSRYPYKIQKGETSTQSYKWNHHAFSSRIKSLEVMPHPNGHIKCLNFRYEKGEPPRIENGNYASLTCDENGGEFIKQISGGFKAGVLQYVKAITSKKRQSKFCKHELEEQCQNFTFGLEENQYPCAIFGENLNQGIVRLGCFMQQLKQNKEKSG